MREFARSSVLHSCKDLSRTPLALMLSTMLLCSVSPSRSQDPGSTARGAVQLTRITPEAAAPETHIELEGFRLRTTLDKGVQVIFVQGTAEYTTQPYGGGYANSDFESRPQTLNIVVPAELQTGPCEVIVEVKGQRSASLPLKINVAATPPTLSSLKPLLPQPGEMIWIDGTGFGESDDFELTDARGKTHDLGNSHGTSSADVAAFRLPSDLPGGEATLRVIERRSGASQVSNPLTFTVLSGPAPLDVCTDWLMPVAPGQWLDFVITSDLPLKDAERVEVSFRQENQVLIVPMEDPKKLRVQVPAAFSPGNVEIQTRTWAAGAASPWSARVRLNLLDKPAASKVYSLDIRPVRAEAAFKQGERIVAISPVADADFPRVRVTTDKLSPGLVFVMTRVWRGGKPSPWLYKNRGFDWPGKFLPDGTIGEVPFMDRISLGPATPPELVAYPGEGLILGGTFPVSSVEDLQVTLECAGRLAIVLKPIASSDPKLARINLPVDLDTGDWDVTVGNDQVAVKLPVKLRIR